MSEDDYKKALADSVVSEHHKEKDGSEDVIAKKGDAETKKGDAGTKKENATPKKEALIEYKDDVGEPDHKPEETNKNPLYGTPFTPKETLEARKLSDAAAHTGVVTVNVPKAM